jgi:hypothetical protein
MSFRGREMVTAAKCNALIAECVRDGRGQQATEVLADPGE